MAIRLVTGCSSGFGEVIASSFAARGDLVIATMRNPSAAPESLNSGNIEILPLDVTDKAARQACVDEVVRRHGRIDTLVNNAGMVTMASIEDTAEDLARQIFDTNFFGPLELMKAVLPVMRAQGGGRIVNVTAIGAILCTPLLGIYCSSKHALDCAGAALDIEARPFGVRVASVLPGQFKTAITAKAPPSVTDNYRGIHASLQASRAARASDMLTDLSPVSDAVLAAATDANPKPRYLAGVGLVDELATSVAEFERLHSMLAERSGLK